MSPLISTGLFSSPLCSPSSSIISCPHLPLPFLCSPVYKPPIIPPRPILSHLQWPSNWHRGGGECTSGPPRSRRGQSVSCCTPACQGRRVAAHGISSPPIGSLPQVPVSVLIARGMPCLQRITSHVSLRSLQAAVVGYEHPIKGQGIYAFVTLMEG